MSSNPLLDLLPTCHDLDKGLDLGRSVSLSTNSISRELASHTGGREVVRVGKGEGRGERGSTNTPSH